MACSPCEKRRKMLAEAAAKSGYKGVIKIIPSVATHMWKQPPKLKGSK